MKKILLRFEDIGAGTHSYFTSHVTTFARLPEKEGKLMLLKPLGIFYFVFQSEVHLADCFGVPKEQLEELSAEDYTALFEEFKRPSNKTFNFNAITNQTFFKNEPLYPECMAQEEWNTNDIQGAILKWRNSIMNTEDLHWFHDPSSEPLDPINPRIQITFDQLVGRPGFEKLKVNSSVYLFNNRLLVGRILWQWYKSTFLHYALQGIFFL